MLNFVDTGLQYCELRQLGASRTSKKNLQSSM